MDTASIQHHLEQYGSPARPRQPDSTTERFDAIERRLQRLEEASVQRRHDALDVTSLQFANLRLLQIQETYDRAVAMLVAADDDRRRAQEALAAITADYRAVIEQFLLPPTPPE